MTTRDKNFILHFVRQSAAGQQIRKMRDEILKATSDICDDLDTNDTQKAKSKIIKLESLILNYEDVLEHTFIDSGALAQNILNDYDLNILPKEYVECQFTEE